MSHKAVILAGGLGTRLATIAPDLPKVMVEINHKPFLFLLITRLKICGIADIILCVGHLSDSIRDYFGDGSAFGVQIQYSVEKEPRGTGGALILAERHLDSTFLLLNGDTYAAVDVREMLEAHRRWRAVGTIGITHVHDASQYGSIVTDEKGGIVHFQEKPETRSASCLANAGIYVFEPTVLEYIPHGKTISLERQVFPVLVERGITLMTYPVPGPVLDIGTPEGYTRARKYLQDPEQWVS